MSAMSRIHGGCYGRGCHDQEVLGGGLDGDWGVGKVNQHGLRFFAMN